MSVSEYGKKLLAGIEANKLTIEELEAVVDVLDDVLEFGIPGDVELCDALKTAAAKMRWHIAASRNELDDDYLLSASEGKTK